MQQRSKTWPTGSEKRLLDSDLNSEVFVQMQNCIFKDILRKMGAGVE